jgi:hypothetical protein
MKTRMLPRPNHLKFTCIISSDKKTNKRLLTEQNGTKN